MTMRGTPHHAPDSMTAAAVATARSWVIGAVVYALASLLVHSMTDSWATDQRLESTEWRVFLLYLPAALYAFLATLAAAQLHPEPFRDQPAAHLLACLPVPVVAQLVSLLRHRGAGVEGQAAPTVAMILGCLVAVAVDLRLSTGTPD
ncbi:hypothetical protein [Streptomyces sp. NPDC005438]|uniref:hypothetical protein n=1 Tax=Streptomyces sp. NPDC005438 TaxID=3156880 RepID=UPI0033BE3031